MSNQSKPQNNGGNQLQMSPELVAKFLDNQGQQFKLQAQQNEIQKKQIDSNEKIALKQLEYQANYLNKNPKQVRWNFAVIGIFTILIIVVIAVFICYLLSIGKDDIAKSILTVLTHIATLFIGYFAGRKGLKSLKSDQHIEPIEEE